MNDEKAKPCADCGKQTVVESAKLKGITAAGTYDLLRSWGVSEQDASAAVDTGIRATDAHDKVSVLAAALSASGERARVCEEAYVELEKEYETLENSYNVLQEAFEGHYSDVGNRLPKEPDYDNEEPE